MARIELSAEEKALYSRLNELGLLSEAARKQAASIMRQKKCSLAEALKEAGVSDRIIDAQVADISELVRAQTMLPVPPTTVEGPKPDDATRAYTVMEHTGRRVKPTDKTDAPGTLDLSIPDPHSTKTVTPGSPIASDSETIVQTGPEKYQRPGHVNVVKEKVAAGGMGIVYKAYQKDLGRIVALKVPIRNEPNLISRFQREIDITTMLEGYGVVSIFRAGQLPDSTVEVLEDVEVSKGMPYYTMDFVKGKTLDDIIKEKKLDAKEVLRKIFIPACGYVHNMHRHKIVHRDLKPANIMMQDDGQVKIMDLGLAKKVGEPDLAGDRKASDVKKIPETQTFADAKLTLADQTLGSPAYMAPEQWMEEEADARTDVYELGVILYEILAKRTHIDVLEEKRKEAAIRKGESGDDCRLGIHQIAARAVKREFHDEYPTLDEADPTIDRQLVSIVKKAMGYEREERYKTAEALAKDVQAWLEGERVSAHKYTKWERLNRFVAEHTGAVVGGAATAVLAIAATIGGAVALDSVKENKLRATRAEAREAKEREGKARAQAEASTAKAKLTDTLQKQLDASKERFKGKELLDRNINLETAIRHYDAALTIDPDYVDAHFERGLAHYISLKPHEAVENFVNANSVSQKIGEKKKDLRALMYAGLVNLDLLNDINKGLEFFKQVQGDVEDPYVLISKSVIEFSEGNLDEAVRLASQASEKGFWEATYLLAAYHSAPVHSPFKQKAKQELPTALKHITKALRQKPNQPRCLYFRSQINENLGNLEAALEDANTLVEMAPNVAEFYNIRGVALYKLGRGQESLSDLEKAAKLLKANGLKPTDENCGYRGMIFSSAGRWLEAEKCFTEAIELAESQDNMAFNYAMRGRTRIRLNKLDEAFEDLQISIKTDSEYWVSHCQLGIYYQTINDINNAIPAFRKAIALKAREVGAWYAEGVNLKSVERLRKYIATTDKAVAQQLLSEEKEK